MDESKSRVTVSTQQTTSSICDVTMVYKPSKLARKISTTQETLIVLSKQEFDVILEGNPSFIQKSLKTYSVSILPNPFVTPLFVTTFAFSIGLF
jgi:hypothetical protein